MDHRPVLAYMLRAGLSRGLCVAAEDAARRTGASSNAAFWRAIALGREGNFAGALRELEALRGRRDAELAAVHAHAHFAARAGQSVDQTAHARAVAAAMERVALPGSGGAPTSAVSASVSSLLLAASFLTVTGRDAEAEALVDSVLTYAPTHDAANTLKGWIRLSALMRPFAPGPEAPPVTHAHVHTHAPPEPDARTLEAASAAIRYFEAALSASPVSKPGGIDAALGCAAVYACVRGGAGVARAAELLTEVLAHHPWFAPAVLERARILLSAGDLDGATESLNRLLDGDVNPVLSSVQAQSYVLAALYTLTREGPGLRAVQRLQDVVDAINRSEPRNARLMYDVSRVCARICGRARAVLSLTLTLVDAAFKLEPECSAYAAELGFQRLLAGDASAASSAYRDAARLDEASSDAVTGLIACECAAGRLDDAEAQLEMFRMISESIGRTADVALLDAQLAWRKLGDRGAALRFLDEAVQLHARVCGACLRAPPATADGASLALREGRPAGYMTLGEHLYRVDPDFLLEVAREYLQQTSRTPSQGASALFSTPAHDDALDASSSSFRRGMALIQTVTDVVPACMSAWLLQASAYAAASSWEGAVHALTRALDIDPTYTDAHLLLAQVGLAQGDARMASTALEQALAQNFAVQESVGYMRMKAAVLAATGKHAEAIQVLDTLVKVPGVRTVGAASSGRARAGAVSGPSVSLTDRAAVFLLLAESHMALDHLPEATKVVSDAMAEFAGTTEETRVTLASAQLAVKRADVDGALALLSGIPPSTPAYAGALALKADIYLKHRRDRRMYVNMFQEIVDRSGRSERALVDLGDAYMRVQMPEEAISAFEEALRLRPWNTELASRIGRALILMHDYKRAITYYRTALSAATGPDAAAHAADTATLRSDLTELLVKLQRFDEAKALIEEALTASPAAASAVAAAAAASGGAAPKAPAGSPGASGGADVVTLRHVRKNLLLQAKVQRGAGAVKDSMVSLEQAMSVQVQLLTVARRDTGGSAAAAIDSERGEAANLCMQLGEACEHATSPPADDKAREFYTDALRYVDGFEPALLALAKLHLRRGDVEECRKACAALTAKNPGHEEANVMLADLLFKQNDAASATFHFSAILEKKPTNYDAMSRLFTLLKRAGKLEDAGRFLKAAVRAVPAAENDPGYRFCKGKLSRFMNEPHEAIKVLNSVRANSTWGVAATELMIDIYLSPDNDPLWSERAGEAAAAGSTGAAGNAEALRVASKLLDDLPASARTLRHEALAACIQIASRTKAGLDDAVARLTGILERSPDYVPALMAIATAFMVQKQTPKARNNAKRLLKLPFDVEHTDDFVRGWLLLADTFIESGKFDQAQDALKQALELDASCARAYEYLGAIAEREVRYAEAADLYEKAWAYEANASAPVGYKLAFNYLKAGRLVEAIDVCRKVLQLYPDYPRIREDVLNVARGLLRP